MDMVLDFTPEDLRGNLKKVRARLLFTVGPENELAEKYPASLDIAGMLQSPDTQVVFRNDMFTVIQLDAPPAKGITTRTGQQ